MAHTLARTRVALAATLVAGLWLGGRAGRGGVEGGLDHLVDALGAHRGLAPAPWPLPQQAEHTGRRETGAPEQHGRPGHPDRLGDGAVGHPLARHAVRTPSIRPQAFDCEDIDPTAAPTARSAGESRRAGRSWSSARGAASIVPATSPSRWRASATRSAAAG